MLREGVCGRCTDGYPWSVFSAESRVGETPTVTHATNYRSDYIYRLWLSNGLRIKAGDDDDELTGVHDGGYGAFGGDDLIMGDTGDCHKLDSVVLLGVVV